MKAPRVLLRPIVAGFHGLEALVAQMLGMVRRGVLAIALTPEGRIVLVRLTYASGWRLPGGGIGRNEDPAEGALREMREEIGMTAHGSITCIGGGDPTFFLVRDVVYSPRRSLEIAAVGEFDLDELPPGTAPITLHKLAEAEPFLRPA